MPEEIACLEDFVKLLKGNQIIQPFWRPWEDTKNNYLKRKKRGSSNYFKFKTEKEFFSLIKKLGKKCMNKQFKSN